MLCDRIARLTLLAISCLCLHAADTIRAAARDVTTAEDSDAGSSGGDGGGLAIEYEDYKVETGSEAQFVCRSSHYDDSDLWWWWNANGTSIDSLNSTRVTDVDGTLTLRDVTLQDGGEYTCVTRDGAYNESVTLQVYVMPTYFKAGMLVLAIDGALVVLFCSCLVVTTVRQKRESRRYRELQQSHANSDKQPRKAWQEQGWQKKLDNHVV